jgi:hypothetical protein
MLVKFARRALVVLFCLAMSACSELKTSLQINKLAGKNPTEYAWASRPLQDIPGAADMHDADALFEVDHLLRKRIDRAMQQANFILVPKSRALLLVDYRLATRTENSVPGTAAPMDTAARTMAGAEGIDPNNTALYNHPVRDSYRVANLWVTIKDTTNGEIVWEATAENTIASNDPDREQVRKRVDEVISHLFERFPNALTVPD